MEYGFGGSVLSSHCETDSGIMMQSDAVIRDICDVVKAECNAVFGDRILSLVLTGSAARGEATIVHSENGWKVLGDAELLVILRRTPTVADKTSMDVVKRASADKLRSQGIVVAIDLGVVTGSYLKNLPPYIFSYELRANGRVVSGDPTILQLIPQFAITDISREDAWRMLCNRMIEQLSFVDDLSKSIAQMTQNLHYATVKLFLDMATSYLVFVGKYEPTYRERAKRLESLAGEDGNEAPFPLRKFANRIAECTAWKLSGDESNCDLRLELWHEAISYLRQLWRWEVMRMIKTTGNFSDAELCSRLSKQLTRWQKLRGWASVLKRSGGFKSWHNWRRWSKLGLRATPRYWIYRAGMEMAFNLPDLVAPTADGSKLGLDYLQLASILPMCKMKSGSREEVWRLLARQIAANYWKYLADTRA
ncbi:MAG TPA: hypothetical protein VGS11_03895 [Candidatus Bathyarchaeia archaeon]|nr:hypothetical protein [Candidatus Bathyarchaeia archaeon]